MRKVVYIDNDPEIKKLMIYESEEGVFLFGYDCVNDSSAKWDNWIASVHDAEEYCGDIYKIQQQDWIVISDPVKDCQHDFIMPTRAKGREKGTPEFGKLQTYIDNRWVDVFQDERLLSFNGLSGNERLFISGLMNEFERLKETDKVLAAKILKALKFDENSINQYWDLLLLEVEKMLPSNILKRCVS